MYQWQESSKTETEEHYGGGATETTTYNYSKEWSANPIDSGNFEVSNGHYNPGMPISGKEIEAQPVTLGQFTLSEYFVGQMDDYQPLQMPDEEQAQVLEKLSALRKGKKNQTYGDYFYVSENPHAPQIGDLRIQFKIVPPAIISVVAKQAGSRLDTYTTEPDFSLEFYDFPIVNNNIRLFEYGDVTADAMFIHAKQENVFWTWIFRLVGFVMMFVGLSMIFGVLRILAAVIPFLGQIVGVFSSLITFVIATILSLITIAIAWLFYRPLLSVILFVIAGGILYLLRFLRKKPQQQPITVPGTGEIPQPMLVPQQSVPQPMVMPQSAQPVMAQPMPYGAQPVMAQPMPYGTQPVMAQPMPYGTQPVMAQPMVMPQSVPQPVVMAQPTAQPMVMPQSVQPVMAQPMVMPQSVQPVMAQPMVMPQSVQPVMAQPAVMPQSVPQPLVMAQPMVMPQSVQQTGVPQNINLAPQPMLVPEMAVPQKS